MDRALAEVGPLFGALRSPDWRRWEEAARWLETQLPDGPTRARRIHWLTVPLFCWLVEALERRPHPLMVGLSAPQGSGKSTLTALLVALLERGGARAVALSIDDFYLPRDAQIRLAAAHPGDPYLQHRGYPGTHDLELGARTLAALRRGEAVELPRYDKTVHGGRGDRRALGEPAPPKLDLVLLEGWMLGFEPVASPPPELAVENELLRGYRAWTEQLDLLISARAADPRFVLTWRVEAEQVLSRAEAEDYARRFLPAYALWGDGVRADLRFTLDLDRLPLR